MLEFVDPKPHPNLPTRVVSHPSAWPAVWRSPV